MFGRLFHSPTGATPRGGDGCPHRCSRTSCFAHRLPGAGPLRSIGGGEREPFGFLAVLAGAKLRPYPASRFVSLLFHSPWAEPTVSHFAIVRRVVMVGAHGGVGDRQARRDWQAPCGVEPSVPCSVCFAKLRVADGWGNGCPHRCSWTSSFAHRLPRVSLRSIGGSEREPFGFLADLALPNSGTRFVVGN